ncbi:MAG: glycosyltransferase family 2 protein [Thermoanaerobaculia bacterium]|nr:glycosyltransferase family 2 protein [Thermoanaerobaculia bacterium]
MTEIALYALFSGAVLVVLYIYFGYPLLIFVLSRLRAREIASEEITPPVTMIIPVFNEADVVERKIQNCLELDYPVDRLDVLFISDGSTDATEQIIGEHERDQVRLASIPRSGKAAALNRGVELASGEIVVFTDANVELRPDALRRIVRPFADVEVGGVSGRKTYVIRDGSDTTEKGENLYWRWDQWQKKLESRIGSMFAADGSLYAVRRELFVPIEKKEQADDIAISARVVLQGRRLVFEPDAIAVEEAPAEGVEEFRRKVRVTNHSMRALLNLGSALWTSGFYSVELLSHKLIRHLIPFFLMIILLSSIGLTIMRPWFGALLALQIVFYGLAMIGGLLRRLAIGRWKILSIPYYFCLVNAAAFVGALSVIRGTKVREWTPRSA